MLDQLYYEILEFGDSYFLAVSVHYGYKHEHSYQTKLLVAVQANVGCQTIVCTVADVKLVPYS